MTARLILLIAAAASLLLAAPALAQEAPPGQRIYNAQCRACHTAEQGGRNGVGPNLHGVLGRKAAAVEGFRYSAALRAKAEAGMVWDETTLRAFLQNPRAVVPGGSMTYAGLRNEQQMDELIAYLKR